MHVRKRAHGDTPCGVLTDAGEECVAQLCESQHREAGYPVRNHHGNGDGRSKLSTRKPWRQRIDCCLEEEWNDHRARFRGDERHEC